jgi:UPF0755 protein
MAYYHSRYAQQKPKRPFRKFILRLLMLLIIAGIGAGFWLYTIVYSPNVWTQNKQDVGINLPTGSRFDQLKEILYSKGLIIHRANFEWWAKQRKLPGHIKPGHYVLHAGMNNNDLIEMLRTGKQTPIRVTFNNIANIYQLAGKVGKQIEADSASIVHLLTDSVYLARMGKTTKTVETLFIPNTYEFYWNTDANEFISRMFQESTKFWNSQRKLKAEKIGLSPEKVVVLASIVEKETNKNDEKPKIASVYINRLHKGWRLQADPTIIYAMGDKNIKRVLNVYKQIDSPYNTYRHGGLPPGPICIPSIASIDAVLNYDQSHYLFFCAKDDLSGYHAFAKTNRQHQINAKKYQQALNKLKIYK